MDLGAVIREHITFYGRVQGVGFRYLLQYGATDRGLNGWVRNRYDGSVEAEIQGNREDIDSLIEGMKKTRFVRIKEVRRTEIPPVDGEGRFRIVI